MPDKVARLSEAQAARLTRFYEQAEREILDRLNRALLKGNQTEYLAAMKKNINQILEQLRAGSRTWCTEAIPRVYVQGATMADRMITEAGFEVTSGAGFGAIHQQAAQVLAENAFESLDNVAQAIGRRTEGIYRDLALENVRGAVTGYDTWKQAARNFREQLAERGVTGFKDRTGREWNMRSYSEMVARTTTMEAHNQGTINRLAESDFDLVIVSSHGGACKLCVPWESKVLSITGKTPGYPTLAEAKAAGLFHPNCAHAMSLYIDLEEGLPEPEEVGSTSPEPVQPKFDSVAEVEKIRQDIQSRPPGQQRPTMDELKKAGRVLMEELEGRRAGLKSQMDSLQSQLDAIETPEFNRRRKELRDKFTRANMQFLSLNPVDGKEYEYWKAEKTRLHDELMEWTKPREAVSCKLIDVRDQYYGEPMDNMKDLAQVLSKFRPVGLGGLDLKSHYLTRSKARDALTKAYSVYPEDWVKSSVNLGGLVVKCTRRGYYSFSGEIALSGSGEDQVRCAIHELGHRFSHVRPDISHSEGDFYAYRTSGEPLTWLGPGYNRNERTRKDRFISPYMGKDYRGVAYELVSMGFEYAYTSPVELWKDREYAEWVYGQLLLH